MSRKPRDKIEKTYSFVAVTQLPKHSHTRFRADRQIFSTTKPKKDKSPSLLALLREVDELEELIPPNPPPIVPRPVVMPRLSMDLAARTIRSSTDTAYHNAFSDLEAIAELGASIDDTDSVVSEQSGRSSIADRFSPSGSVETHRNYRNMDTADSLRSNPPNFTSAQISPMEAQKSHYRQRYAPPGMQPQSIGKGTDVFDFVPDEQLRMHQFAHGMQYDDQGQQFSMPMGPTSASYVQGAGYSPHSAALLPNSAPITGSTMNPIVPFIQQQRRRGRARKVGNMGDRQPSKDDYPDSPMSERERMMHINSMYDGKKQRGGTTTRRPRRPRKTPSTVGEQMNYSYQMNEADRPLLQRSFSERTTSFKPPNYDEQPKMLTEQELLDDESSEEETDPPRYMQPLTSSVQINIASVQQQSKQKQEAVTPTTGEPLPSTSIQSTKNSGPPSTSAKKLSVAYSSSSSASSEKTSPSPPNTDYSAVRASVLGQKPSLPASTPILATKDDMAVTPTQSISINSALQAPKKPIQEKMEEVRERVRQRDAPVKPIHNLRQSISSSESSEESSEEEEEFPVLKPPEPKARKSSVESSATIKPPRTNAESVGLANDTESESRKHKIQPPQKTSSTHQPDATASPTSAPKVVLRLKPKSSGSSSSSSVKNSMGATPVETVARLSSGAPPLKKVPMIKSIDARPPASTQPGSSSVKHKLSGAPIGDEKRAVKRKADSRLTLSGAKEGKISKKSPAETLTAPPPTLPLGFPVGMASLKNFKIPKVQEEKPESPVTSVPPQTPSSTASFQESRSGADNRPSSQSFNPTGHFTQFHLGQSSSVGSSSSSSSSFNSRRPPPPQPRSILKNPSSMQDFGNPQPYRQQTAPSQQQRKPFTQEQPSRGSYRGQAPHIRPPFNAPSREKQPQNWMPMINTPQAYQSSSKEQRQGYYGQPNDRDPYNREVKDDSPSEQLQIDESE